MKKLLLIVALIAARYLNLSIGCLKGVPEWHHYFGRNASVYVDEIIVE